MLNHVLRIFGSFDFGLFDIFRWILRIFRFACIFIRLSTSLSLKIWFNYFWQLDSILFYDLIQFHSYTIWTRWIISVLPDFLQICTSRFNSCILYFWHIVRGLPSPHLTWFSTIFGSIQERIIWRSETSFSYLFWVTERSRQLFFSVKISGFPSTLHHQHSLGTSSPCYPTSFPFGVQGCSITPVPPWQHGG